MASCRAIAAALGVSKSTVHRDVQASGHWGGRCVGRDGKTYPSSRESHHEVIAIALTALEQGRPSDEIAREIGVSPRTLRRWRREWRLVA